MSDENSSGTASSPEPMIPKSRLDELIAERNDLRQEKNFLLQQVGELGRSRQPMRPEQEDPELEEMKQRDPVAYRKFKKQEQDAKQLRAANFMIMDKQDRLEYLQETGGEGKKVLGQVEQVLQAERQRGNFNVTRTGIFNYLKGEESVKRARELENAPAKKAASEPVESNEEAPSSDPKFASTIRAGTASSSKVEKSREERIRELENIEF